MMTFKEVNDKIEHYQEELKRNVDHLNKINLYDDKSESDEIKAVLQIEKLKVEFFSFVTCSYIDMLCTYRNFKRSKSNWENAYNLKIAYLLIYETINTYHKYRGQLFQTLKKEEQEIYHRFFRMLNEELSEFKYKFDYDNIMPKIRNKATAHYDRNFLDYYESLNLLDSADAKNIIREFLYFLNPLHYFAHSLGEGEVNEFLFINGWLS